tara:strand:- start:282 stop:494 length:213 start_codon:yes stop_codon:yes gene_type:complete
MSLRKQLKKDKTVRGRRWTIRKDKDDNLTEVKMIFKPEEYSKYKNAREMYGDKALLEILEKDYEKKKNNS